MSLLISKALGIPADPFKYEEDTRLILPKCRIGVEFEFERCTALSKAGGAAAEFNTDLGPYFKMTKDDSLRDSGMEFVFRDPMFGADALEAIRRMCEFAKKYKFSISKRTGLHIHVDVRDVEPAQLVGMLLLYAIYEPAVYQWVGDNRHENIFCLPWYQAEGGIIEVTRVIQAANTPPSETERFTLKEESKRVSRYAGLNLNALSKYGSIEWRHLLTTTDFGRIVNWANIALMFKAAVDKLPSSDGAILKMVNDLGPTAFGKTIFGSNFNILTYPDLDKEVREIGIPTARELVREGLRSLVWEAVSLPKGESKGFKKWVKETEVGKALPERTKGLTAQAINAPAPPSWMQNWATVGNNTANMQQLFQQIAAQDLAQTIDAQMILAGDAWLEPPNLIEEEFPEPTDIGLFDDEDFEHEEEF